MKKIMLLFLLVSFWALFFSTYINNVSKVSADTQSLSHSLTNFSAISDYSPGGIMLKLSSEGKNKGIAITTNYRDSSDPATFKGGKIDVVITSNFDVSETSAIAQGHLSTWGLAFMGILQLPDYLQADQIIAGVKKAYQDNPNDFRADIYKKDGNVGRTLQLNDQILSVYDGHDHDHVDPHKLALTARGPALVNGIWSDVWHLYTSPDYDKSNFKIRIHFSIDVTSAMANGISDNYDKSPNKKLTANRLPPAPDGNLKLGFQFYDCDQVSNKDWGGIFSASSEIHITTGQEGTPSYQSETDGFPTWSDYLSPWDKSEEYNTSSPPFSEVSGVSTALPGDYLNPVIQWNGRLDGPVTNDESFKNSLLTRFGRAVNIINKKVDTKAALHIQTQNLSSASGELNQNIYTFSGKDERGNPLNAVPFTINSENDLPVIKSGTVDKQPIEKGQKVSLQLKVLAKNIRKLKIFGSNSDSPDAFVNLGEQDISQDKEDEVTLTVNITSLIDFSEIGSNRTLYFKVCNSEAAEKGMSDVQEVPIKLAKWGTSPYYWDSSSGTLTIDAGNLQSVSDSPYKNGAIQPNSIKKIIFTGKTIAPADCTNLFGRYKDTPSQQLNQLNDFEGFKWLDTSNTTNMSYMFYGANFLSSLDVSHFNTKNVKHMTSMFAGTSSLDELDLSSFNTSEVKGMNNMFSGMINLKTLKLGSDFSFKEDAGLPEASSSSPYTGKWHNLGAGGDNQHPLGKNLWNASEFMSLYNGATDADSYIWQPNGLYINQVAQSFNFPNIVIKGENQTILLSQKSALTLTDALTSQTKAQVLVAFYDNSWQQNGLVLSMDPSASQDYVSTQQIELNSQYQAIVTQFDENKKNESSIVNLDFGLSLKVPKSIEPRHYSATIDWNLQQGPS